MNTVKNISWNTLWLESVKWSEFRTSYFNRLFLNIPENERERELYLFFKHLTGRKVVSLEKKYPE